MIIDGRKLAEEVIDEIKKDLFKLKQKEITPKLAIITLGLDASWKTYVEQKIKLAKRLGIQVLLINLKGPTEQQLLKAIERLNNNNNVHGIIVQRPFSKHIDKQKVTNSIHPEKDIDGFRADSPYQVPVWLAVERILLKIKPNRGSTLKRWIKSKKIVVIGKGETAGGPTIQGLQNLGIKPHIIDSRTKNSEEILKNADIVISAVGKRVVEADDLKPGVILIGIGLARDEDRLHGDYNEEQIKNVASFYTPTPGGVGPLNLAFLFKNLIKAAKKL